MDVSRLLNDLNPAQREAVAAPEGPLLILAGAGSGKTRVLTHRVAWLVEVLGVSPHAILAVTFTNKAANEMRGRIEAMLGFGVGGMWIGTFHGLSHRLLRAHWKEAGLPQNFQILDSEDQYRVVRRVLKAMELDEAYWPPRQAQWFINGHKEAGRRVSALGEGQDPHTRQWNKVYREYEKVFGGANRVAVALMQKEGDIFTRPYMEKLKGLTDDIFLLNGVDRPTVKSLFTPNTRFMLNYVQTSFDTPVTVTSGGVSKQFNEERAITLRAQFDF